MPSFPVNNILFLDIETVPQFPDYSSLPDDWKIPKDTPEILIRQCIGESMPPLMLKKIINLIWKEDEKN